MQAGCFSANAMQLEAGKTMEERLPCAGEGSNGGRVQMLPVGIKVEAADCPYYPMGALRLSFASPPFSGALALKRAVEILEGKKISRETILPLPVVTKETIKLCETGSWEEMHNGCNAFPPSSIPNPGWFVSIYSPETPEVGMEAALIGQLELGW